VDINEAIQEVSVLTQGEADKHGVSLRTQLAPRLAHVEGDRLQLQGVRVGVRDTGPGLSPESLPRLFEPFYTTKAGGLGMGLVICRSIIEAHGGQLWTTACEPQRALFQFTIPISPGAAS
jgi:signal transduction histidine kinase